MNKSISEIIYLSFCKLCTSFLFPSARLIRFPIDIRGKCAIDFGKNLTTGYHCRIETYPVNKKAIVLKFGNNVQLNDFVHIAARSNVEIGNNVLIASKVFITDISHGTYSGIGNHSSPLEAPAARLLTSKQVVIEDNVWIGEFVSILPGVTIGKGSIIGSNSVITKSVPPFSIVVGNPGQVIKEYSFDKLSWQSIHVND